MQRKPRSLKLISSHSSPNDKWVIRYAPSRLGRMVGDDHDDRAGPILHHGHWRLFQRITASSLRHEVPYLKLIVKRSIGIADGLCLSLLEFSPELGLRLYTEHVGREYTDCLSSYLPTTSWSSSRSIATRQASQHTQID